MEQRRVQKFLRDQAREGPVVLLEGHINDPAKRKKKAGKKIRRANCQLNA